MDTFKALWITEGPHGAFQQELIQRRIDELPAGEVLIKVCYSSLNYKDALSAIGERGVARR